MTSIQSAIIHLIEERRVKLEYPNLPRFDRLVSSYDVDTMPRLAVSALILRAVGSVDIQSLSTFDVDDSTT